jgi:glutaconyl-CoA/methylmalonyl-CoA decarboxylase subunit gamma
MKKLRITVNDRVYDVQVQVLEDDEGGAGPTTGSLPPAPTMAGPALAPRPAQPAPAPSAAPPAMPRPSPGGPGDPNVIASPIAGTVQKLFVAVCTRVEAKTPVVLLDAMKMDTYIYAPRGGEVAEVCTAVGAAVQVGEVLIRFRPEG